MKQYLEAGELVTTHGVSGELRLYPWSDSPEFLTAFKCFYLDEQGRKPLKVSQLRRHKNICIVQLEGVASINDARALIGKTVYINRDDIKLPQGHYFVQDLLGLQVIDADTAQCYGTIANVTHPGRHDIYEVQQQNGQIALFPAVQPFLVGTDLAAGQVTVRPIPGMFGEGAE